MDKIAHFITPLKDFCSDKPRHLDHKLNRLLHDTYAEHEGDTGSAAYIFFAKDGVGKTPAAVELLFRVMKKNDRGRLVSFKHAKNQAWLLGEKAKNILGLPSMSDEDLWSWFNVLTQTNGSSLQQKMQAAYEFLSGAFTRCTGTLPESIEQPPTKGKKYPPVVVFDGLNVCSDHDIGFLERFVEMAEKCGVLVIISTSSEETAKKICEKTAVSALASALDNTTGKWNGFDWLCNELTDYLLADGSPFRDELLKDQGGSKRFFDAEDLLQFVEKGMTPRKAHHAAWKELHGNIGVAQSGSTLAELTPTSSSSTPKIH
jgi:hypothetical protein